MPPHSRQQARGRTSRANLVWEAAHRPPPLPVPAASVAKPWTTRTRHAQTMPSVRHPRPASTDRAPPSPRAHTITTDPGDRQTSPFAAPCHTATARRRRRRLCRAEHRQFQTKPHCPMPRDHVVEHRQETPHRPLPLHMPLAACNVAPDELTVRPDGPLARL
jgi:hypothetical protein